MSGDLTFAQWKGLFYFRASGRDGSPGKDAGQMTYCDGNYPDGDFPIEPPAFSEEDCPGHVASEGDPKICGRCGVHIDSLRPPDDIEP